MTQTAATGAITEGMAARHAIERFATAHKLIFEDHGEVGFGRPCVGLLSRGGGYLDYNPLTATDYSRIPEFVDDRFRAPSSVPDAYHKHDCFAVLVHEENYDAAILQLAAWISHLEAIGPVEVASYATGATGLQALMSGVTGYALRFTAVHP